MPNPRRRTVRKPTPPEPTGLVLNWKLAAFLLPLISIIGTWAVMQYQLKAHDQAIEDLQDNVSAIVLEQAASAGEGVLLAKVRDDIADIKIDLARLRTASEAEEKRRNQDPRDRRSRD